MQKKRNVRNEHPGILIIMVFACIHFYADAQKLPAIQKNGVLAPGNLIIDGILTEWNGNLLANNPVNRFAYTISNDENNLYLSVQLKNDDACQKILKGGLTFMIKPSSQKGKSFSVTYPAVPKRSTPRHEQLVYSPHVYSLLTKAKTPDKTKIDSLITSSNLQFRDMFKEIQVNGNEKNIPSLISIYNEYGIKACAKFSDRMELTYELLIPLNLISSTPFEEMKYNIRLNAQPTVEVPGFHSFDPPVLTISSNDNPDDLYRNFATDLSGTYTMVKR